MYTSAGRGFNMFIYIKNMACAFCLKLICTCTLVHVHRLVALVMH